MDRHEDHEIVEPVETPRTAEEYLGRLPWHARLRSWLVNLVLRDILLEGVRIVDLKTGFATITGSPSGVGDLFRWSGTQAAVALGDLGMDVATGRPSMYVGGSAKAAAFTAEVMLLDGTQAMTGNMNLGANRITNIGAPVDGGDAATKSYVDTIVAPQVNAGGAGGGYIGTGTITEINAVSPVTGDVVAAEDAGTPSAGSSSLLAAGDLAEYNGTSWIKIVANSGGFVPAGTRAIVGTTTTFIAGGGLTGSTDEGKIAIWDGTSIAHTSLFTPADGNIVVCIDDDSVNDGRVFTFNGSVPTGVWEQSSGVGTAHSSLSGLTTGDDHTQYAKVAGRSSGQTLQGGTGAGENLVLESTSSGTKGDVQIASGSALKMMGNDIFVPNTGGQGKVGTSTAKFLEVNALTITQGDSRYQKMDNPDVVYRFFERDDGMSVEYEHTGEVRDIAFVGRGLVGRLKWLLLG